MGIYFCFLDLGTSRNSKNFHYTHIAIGDPHWPTSNPHLEIAQISRLRAISPFKCADDRWEMLFEIEKPPDALATIRRQESTVT